MTRPGALLIAALLAWPSAARAQASEVAALLREGVARRIAGDDETALARFTEAHARCHCAEAMAQMALAAQALGRFASADAWLTEALAARGDRWVDANRAELTSACAAARSQAAVLVVSGEVGASVSVDGEARGDVLPAGALRVRVDPGRRRVSLTTGDGRSAEGSVEVIAGGESALRVTLPPRPTRTAVRRSPERPTAWRSAAPWVALAGTAGVAAGTVAFTFERRYTAIWASPDCLVGNRTREDNCGSWRVSAERAEAAAIASWAVGGAMLAAAAGMWWIAPRVARRVSVRCSPTGSAGVACGGTF